MKRPRTEEVETEITLEQLEKLISSMTESEARSINAAAVKRINKICRQKTFEKLSMFCVGDKVSFKTQEGKVVTGTVKTVNQKSVTIENCDDGNKRWRVSPFDLSKKL